MPLGPYDFEIDRAHAVVAFRPRLNNVPWAEIERVGDEILSDLHAHGTPPCIIDLTQQTQMGSAMVALIVRIWKAVRERGGRVAVVCRHAVVLQVISLAGLDKVWTVVGTRDDAYQSLGVRPPQGAFSSARNTTRPIALAISLVGAVAAIIGVTLLVLKRAEPPVWQGLVFAGAAVGFIAGLLATIQDRGGRRAAAICAVVLCVGAALYGCLHIGP